MTTSPDHSDHDPLAERVLEHIRSERPRPRWTFLVRNYFFWALGALTVVFGALAVAASVFDIENVDWRLASVTHDSFVELFFSAAPFLWIGTLILFVAVGYVTIRRTEHGYRYPLALITLGAILLSVVLGVGLYAAGVGEIVERIPGDQIPFYRPIITQERSWWNAPERGLLGGEVVSATPGAASFALRDFSGRVWQVDGSDLRAAGQVAVARGGTVRLVGVPTTATSTAFHACFAFSWETHGAYRNAPPPPPLTTFAALNQGTTTPRSDACRAIRPYQVLRDLDDAGL